MPCTDNYALTSFICRTKEQQPPPIVDLVLKKSSKKETSYGHEFHLFRE